MHTQTTHTRHGQLSTVTEPLLSCQLDRKFCQGGFTRGNIAPKEADIPSIGLLCHSGFCVKESTYYWSRCRPCLCLRGGIYQRDGTACPSALYPQLAQIQCLHTTPLATRCEPSQTRHLSITKKNPAPSYVGPKSYASYPAISCKAELFLQHYSCNPVHDNA